MNPTSFFFIISLIILLFPDKAPGKLAVKSEKELKNNTSVNVRLHINTSSMKTTDTKNSQIKETFELSPEYFEEDPLQIEDWMNSPKSWNTKQDL